MCPYSRFFLLQLLFNNVLVRIHRYQRISLLLFLQSLRSIIIAFALDLATPFGSYADSKSTCFCMLDGVFVFDCEVLAIASVVGGVGLADSDRQKLEGGRGSAVLGH